MKKIYPLLYILNFIVSCASYTKPESDSSLMEQINELSKDNRCFLLIKKADLMKQYFPNSSHKKESEYLRGDCLSKVEPNTAYAHWLDFAKIYPDYKTQEVQQKTSESKDLQNKLGYLGFFELSLGRSLSESGALSANGSSGSGSLTYLRHSEEEDDLGYYLGIKWYNFNDTILANEYDINATNIVWGLSYKKTLKKDKLISYFNIAPSITSLKYWKKSNKDLTLKGDRHIGLNFNSSLDILIYDRKKAMSGNGKWYLTLGLNADIIQYDLFGRDSTGVITSGFLGIKL